MPVRALRIRPTTLVTQRINPLNRISTRSQGRDSPQTVNRYLKVVFFQFIGTEFAQQWGKPNFTPEYTGPEKILENIPDRFAGTDRPDLTGMGSYPNNSRAELACAPGYQKTL